MYIGLFKTDTISVQSSRILSPSSSVTGTATYKITDADINTGSVINLASATGSYSGQTITSPQNIVTVHYNHPINDRNNNGGSENDSYGGAVVPVVPAPMIYNCPMNNPMYGNPMYDRVPAG
jgi:hypothetical protein